MGWLILGRKTKCFCKSILTDASVIVKAEILMLLRSMLAWAEGQDFALNLGRSLIDV